MKFKISNLFLGVFFITPIFSQQTPVEVTDQTIKVGIGLVQELYFGFAEGDEIILNFEELKGKPLKTIKIEDEYGNPKFSDFKVSSITDKRIKVQQKGVFKFSFENTALTGRICKIHIQRVPASEQTKDFNTNLVWKTLYDTTYIPYTKDSLVGYDSIPFQETVKELISTEMIEEMILDKTQKVHSLFNENSSKTYLRVDLPQNNIETYREVKTVAWVYWLGVGDEARQAYAQNVQAFGNLTSEVVSMFGSPLAGLAIGAMTELITPKKGEDVEYYFVPTFQDIQNFQADLSFRQFNQGKGIAAYEKYDTGLNSTFYVAMRNDNNVVGIDVNLKVVVIREVKTYKDVTYNKIRVKPRYVTLNKQRMKVTSQQVRACAE